MALAAEPANATVQLVALTLGFLQTLALAVMADRSRRVRKDVRRRAAVARSAARRDLDMPGAPVEATGAPEQRSGEQG